MKLYIQNVPVVWQTTASVVASGSTSGSVLCAGYARLVGTFYANASAAGGTGSGLHITQSPDYGTNWDIITASYPITASAASSFDVAVVGNAVKVQVWNGVTEAASLMRAWFVLRPV